MPTESDNYAKGSSGFGAPNYSSPAWRAGDIERVRVQSEKDRINRETAQAYFKNRPNEGYIINSNVAGESSGNGYTVFSVFIFVLASVIGLYKFDINMSPETGKIISQYIGPSGYVSKDIFFWSLVASLFGIGVIFRKIIRRVVGLGLLLGVVYGIWTVFN